MNPLDHRIETMQDLQTAWEHIDGGNGYSAPQLFALLIDADGWIEPHIVQLYDEGPPEPELVGNLVWCLGEVLRDAVPGGSVALMKARPGSARLDDLDRQWCRLLHQHLSAAPFATHPLFYATGGGVRVVSPDELITDAS